MRSNNDNINEARKTREKTSGRQYKTNCGNPLLSQYKNAKKKKNPCIIRTLNLQPPIKNAEYILLRFLIKKNLGVYHS